jgi:hypothetical protein
MQPAKKQVRHTKRAAMDNKSCVHFAVICDPVDLDEILEAYGVGDGIFTEPHPKLVARYLVLHHDLETTTVACHIERACKAFLTKLTNFLLQHKSKVD